MLQEALISLTVVRTAHRW